MAQRWWMVGLVRPRGLSWRVYLGIWSMVALAFVSAAVVAIPQTFGRVGAISTPAMLGVALREDQPATIQMPIGREAIASGIRPGDHLAAIDGEPVHSDMKWATRLAGAPGSVATIEVRSADGRRHVHRLTRSPVHLAEAAHGLALTPRAVSAIRWTLLYAINIVFTLGCATLLLWRRSNDAMAVFASLVIPLTAFLTTEPIMRVVAAVSLSAWQVGSYGALVMLVLNAVALALFPMAGSSRERLWPESVRSG